MDEARRISTTSEKKPHFVPDQCPVRITFADHAGAKIENTKIPILLA